MPRSYVEFFREAGVEPDQRLRAALELAGGIAGGELVNDLHVFIALYRLNSISARHIEIDLNKLPAINVKGRDVRDPKLGLGG